VFLRLPSQWTELATIQDRVGETENQRKPVKSDHKYHVSPRNISRISPGAALADSMWLILLTFFSSGAPFAERGALGAKTGEAGGVSQVTR